MIVQKKKTIVFLNTILTILVGITFDYFCFVTSKGEDLLQLKQFEAYLGTSHWLVGIAVLCIFLILRLKKFSIYLYLIFFMILCTRGGMSFAANENKLILIATFLTFSFAYLVGLTFWREFSEAPYVTNYDKSYLDLRFCPYVEIKLLDAPGVLGARMSKVSDNGLCLIMDKALKLTGKQRLQAIFNGRKFEFSGQVMTQADEVLGLKLNLSDKDGLKSWNLLYNILRDRGYYII
ncbi:MAG: hypothetical protein ACPGJV_08045 [Bacteriovoracaceae bacterium]